MKLENQVCTLQQAKRLRELGISQDSFFYHIPAFNEIGFKTITGIAQTIDGATYSSYEIVSAFTVAELGVMLPDYIASDALYTYQQRRGNMDRKYPAKYEVSYWNLGNKILSTFKSDSEAECKASMLIYLLESNLTTPAEVNERLKQN